MNSVSSNNHGLKYQVAKIWNYKIWDFATTELVKVWNPQIKDLFFFSVSSECDLFNKNKNWIGNMPRAISIN